MTRIQAANEYLDAFAFANPNKYQQAANQFLNRFPVDQYSIDHPVYQDLVKLYADLKESYKNVDMSTVQKLFGEREIPVVDFSSKGEIKTLLKTILKNYSLRKLAQLFANRMA